MCNSWRLLPGSFYGNGFVSIATRKNCDAPWTIVTSYNDAWHRRILTDGSFNCLIRKVDTKVTASSCACVGAGVLFLDLNDLALTQPSDLYGLRAPVVAAMMIAGLVALAWTTHTLDEATVRSDAVDSSAHITADGSNTTGRWNSPSSKSPTRWHLSSCDTQRADSTCLPTRVTRPRRPRKGT